MTDKNLPGAASAAFPWLANDLMIYWTMARSISSSGRMHRFVPKEPAWCQQLGDKIVGEVLSAMRLQFDEDRVIAVFPKYLKRLISVYLDANTRRCEHLVELRQRRQANAVSKNATRTVTGGGRDA
jgi:hypothetical protein